MRTLIFREPGRMELINTSMPAISEQEVLVRMKYCGICGTDVHAYRNGLQIPKDTVMGHEIAGTVETVGAGIPWLARGERVIVNPLARCGVCYWCRQKEYSLCETAAAQEIGFHPEFAGGLADFLLIRHPAAMILKIPESVSFKAAALVEPLATSLHAVKKSRLEKGATVLVIGAGMIGLGVIRFLKLAGAGRIIVLEPCREKVGLARELGADVVIDPSSGREETLKAVLAEANGIGASIVYECAGVPSTFQAAATYVRKGGQVILAGFCEEAVGIRPVDWILREIEIKAILGYYDEFAEVLQFLENGDIPAERFISDIVSLKRAEADGFRRVMQDRSVVKILVDMERQA